MKLEGTNDQIAARAARVHDLTERYRMAWARFAAWRDEHTTNPHVAGDRERRAGVHAELTGNPAWHLTPERSAAALVSDAGADDLERIVRELEASLQGRGI